MRTVVITGTSRGLGLASAAHLYQRGWRVVAAMRSIDKGLEKLCTATGASASDPRLIGVKLDLTDLASIAESAKAIERAAGGPDVIVHNAGEAIEDDAPLSRRTVGSDATALAIMARVVPAWLVHKIIRLAMRLPSNGELRTAS